ncbi:MAG: FAD-dependent oxidoreductase [Chlamydiia bacterium]|nr:FAD-dependent oxidoreductase [Chlamydiia bacterium]
MRIAIVGAGMAGLALCRIFSKRKEIEVTLFDAKGIGLGASGVSTGLLHPFPGKHANLSRDGEAAFLESLQFLEDVETESGKKVHQRCGIFRPAIREEQKRDFMKNQIEGLSCWKEDVLFGSGLGSGLWIPKGTVVFMRSYLLALWDLVQKEGVKFQQKNITSLSELSLFDHVIVTAGYETQNIAECKKLHLSKIKGQALLCRTTQPLSFALASHGHISPTEDPQLVLVGSTYERNFSSPDPDPVVALQLLQQVASFYQEALHFEVIQVLSGVRISHPNRHQPIVEKIGKNGIVFTGLGSRGLLYHVFFAKKVAEMI